MQVVPKMFFAGVVDILRILAIEFIDGIFTIIVEETKTKLIKKIPLKKGKCYSSFQKMNVAEKRACCKSVKELHKAMVLHGDLHSRNFIIVNKKEQRKQITECSVNFT